MTELPSRTALSVVVAVVAAALALTVTAAVALDGESAQRPQPTLSARALPTSPEEGSRPAVTSFRCPGASAIPAVAAVGATYLGGRFAAPVRRLPPGAVRMAGTAGTTVVFQAGKELLVRSGSRVTRWLPLGPPADRRPRVLILGDSIILGARDQLERSLAGWQVRFDAQVSRSTWPALAITQRLSPPVDVVVVELGANDGGSAAGFGMRVREILANLRHSRLVVWLTVPGRSPTYANWNRIIRSSVAAAPNGVVADWRAAAPADGLAGDGLHLNPTGARAMAALIGRFLVPWAAAAGFGRSTTCAPPR
jgi:lysophospholipase L1-like esterase